MFAASIVNQVNQDTRKPNEKRLDRIIKQNEEMIAELKLMNKNLSIVGAALITMNEKKSKKVIDTK